MSSGLIPENGDHYDTDLNSVAFINDLLKRMILDLSDWIDDDQNVQHGNYQE